MASLGAMNNGSPNKTLRLAVLVAAGTVVVGCDDQLKQQLAANEKRLAELEERLGKTGERVDGHGQALDALQNDVGELESSAAARRAELKTIEGEVRGLQAAARSHGRDLGRLRAEVSETKSRALDRLSELLFLWDGAENYVGRAMEYDGDGVLFTMNGVAVPVYTAFQDLPDSMLLFTEPGCVGAPVVALEQSVGPIGLLRQSTGEVFVPAGQFARRQLTSAAGLAPGAVCIELNEAWDTQSVKLTLILSPFVPGVRVAPMSWD